MAEHAGMNKSHGEEFVSANGCFLFNHRQVIAPKVARSRGTRISYGSETTLGSQRGNQTENRSIPGMMPSDDAVARPEWMINAYSASACSRGAFQSTARAALDVGKIG